MSYYPKKFNIGRDNKTKFNKDKYHNKPGFINKQYKNLKESFIVKSFEKINDKLKNYNPKGYIVNKYKKFSDSINKPENKKLIQLLPAVLLALTVLAVKNKNLIKPFIDSFYNTKKLIKPDMSMTDKVLLLIHEYGKILYNNANILKTLDTAMTVLGLFIEDIPSIFSKIDSYSNISQFEIHKNLIKNAADLQENLIDKPARERKKIEEKKIEQQELQELRDLIKDLKDKKSKSKSKQKKNNSDSEYVDVDVLNKKLTKHYEKKMSSSNKPVSSKKKSILFKKK